MFHQHEEATIPQPSMRRVEMRPTGNRTAEHGAPWKLIFLGRHREAFVKAMKPFVNSPANIYHGVNDPEALTFAANLHKVLTEAGWNATLAPESKTIHGIKIVTKSSALHADEISGLVEYLRGEGITSRVRVRQEMETESIQIFVGSIIR